MIGPIDRKNDRPGPVLMRERGLGFPKKNIRLSCGRFSKKDPVMS
jgi:hypothetical protein